MLTKKTAATQLEEWQPLFKTLVNKRINLKFGTFDLQDVTILEFRLAKQKDLTNLPDKRPKPEGNGMYTPIMLEAVTDQGILAFIMEDIKVAAIFGGILITTGDTRVEMRLM